MTQSCSVAVRCNVGKALLQTSHDKGQISSLPGQSLASTMAQEASSPKRARLSSRLGADPATFHINSSDGHVAFAAHHSAG